MISSRRPAFAVGHIVRLSELGRERIRTIRADQTGVVVGMSRTGNACRVDFDDRKSAMTVHVTYLERVDTSGGRADSCG